MKHLFIPYELATELKAANYDEPCFMTYYGEGNIHGHDPDKLYISYGTRNSDLLAYNYSHGQNKGNVTAPTYQQVIDWFREKHKLFISITLQTPYDLRVDIYGEGKEILYGTNKFSIEQYYAAYNTAIQEAIKLLKH